MRTLLSMFWLCLALLTPVQLAQTAFAEDNAKTLVKIRILPEKGQIKAGEEIWIATEQSITEHWHTYWKNPGDSGTSTNIDWQLPEGFEISEIQWPTPKKIPYGPLLNYGYENKVILLQKLKAPEVLPAGPLNLIANIELLVCKEECIPEYGTYPLTLNGPNANLEDNKAYLNAARKNLPANADWPAFFGEKNGDFILETTLPQATRDTINLVSVQFLPEDWGLLSNPEKPQAYLRNERLVIEQKRGERSLGSLGTISGILAFETNDAQGFSTNIQASPLAMDKPKGRDSNPIPGSAQSLTFISAVFFALIGGLILNLMPCVFPVLSIKALSLVKIAEKHPDLAKLHGLSYTAGVIISFLLIAGTLIAFQSSGAQIGWGFQLQNPWIVGAIGYLLFMIGLNLMGFFEVPNAFANTGGKLAQNDGLSGSFFTGVLATLVATPCTAPFMAGAIGFAFVQPPLISMIIFTALGLGLALPYLVLSFVPAFQKILPKPGTWMIIFKQALSFPMFIAALWLLWVLAQQTDTMGITTTLFGAILITFSIWLFKHIPSTSFWKHVTRAIAIISVLLAFGLLPTSTNRTNIEGAIEKGFGESFSQSKLETLLKGDNPIFTEMTAAWCITCKINHAAALNIESTKTIFKQENIRYLVGDWTNEDPAITQYLKTYERNGVPLYVFYGARNSVTGKRPEPKLLPQMLTPAIVENTVKGET